MLHIFCESVVDSTIFFAVICWSRSISASDPEKLNKLIKKAGSLLGTALEPLELTGEGKMLHKLLNIMDSLTLPLPKVQLDLLQCQSIFSRKLLLFHNKDQHGRSLLPTAITFYYYSVPGEESPLE